MSDDYAFANELYEKGAHWEAILFSSLNLSESLCNLQDITARANPDEPYWFAPSRLSLAQNANFLGDAVDGLLFNGRQLGGFLTDNMFCELSQVNTTTAFVAGMAGHNHADCLLRLADSYLMFIGIAIDNTKERKPWPFDKGNVQERAHEVVRMLLNLHPDVELQRVEIDLVKEFQRVTGRLPDFDIQNRSKNIVELTAQDAIIAAIKELNDEGIISPSQKQISQKAGYREQTVKNNTPKMVARGVLQKGNNGKGFRVL